MTQSVIGAALTVQLLLVLLSGCTVTHRYVADPDAFPIKQDQVSPLSVEGGVKLVNAQTDDTDRVLVKIYRQAHLGNYHQMTDAAIELARQALEKRGVMVENNGAKTLRLAVVNVEHIPAMWIFRIVVDLQVEYGDGALLLFKGDNSTGGHMFRAYNGALMKAVAAMLNDAEIRAYLEH